LVFVEGRAGDMFGKLCRGESMNSIKGFSIMVGDNVEDTVDPGLELVSDGLMHDVLCFFISKTAAGCWLAKANRDCYQ
jgi:hypothetical protein